ncbi:MAG: biopolymer transporter ExbD [Tepidiphilus sp.]|jgi:biopolymer transport protein ExbD|nr:biopolymer transporter ExbD [Tepidiphilus sp.]MDD3432744.1 biopolymer transporter ExbD [Tepidiphilus sp.]
MAFARLDGTGDTEPINEINMVPFIDVMLVLLIIFIVTAPLMTHAVKVDLPQASSAPDTQRDEERLRLRLDADGQTLHWNDEAIDWAALEPRLAELTPQTTLELQADRATPYEAIARLMAAASRHGLAKIAFVTLPGEPAP